MLSAGEHAPDFELLDQDARPISLQGLLSSGPLLLFFYPADFTPICTREVCLFRDVYADLAGAGLSVAGVSPDRPESHGRFHGAQKLEYPLLSDPDKATIRAYGAAGPLGIVRRATFLIDPSKTIADSVVADLRLGRHEAFIRRAIELGAKRR